MENDIAIGIDLGTTNSCVAIYRNGKVDIIENEMGSRTTPSYVTFTEDGILTGPEAVAEAHKYPKTTIFEAKRLIGQEFINEKVQEDIKHFPFTVINDFGMPKIRIELDGEEPRDYFPEDISAYILQRMKKIAETRSKNTINRAVITVPAYFSDAQRQSTKDAATIAGFKSAQIINEPTAAALAFDHEYKKTYQRNVLVYDFGGGTFDVSVVTIGRSVCKVIATLGDSHLGGTDIDLVIAKHFYNDYCNKNNNNDLDWNNVGIARRFKQKAEDAKIALSGEGRFHYEVEMAQLGTIDYTSSLTRIRLEHLCESIFQRTIDCMHKCLKDSKLSKESIDEVLLVGGSSRIPKIQQLIENYFGPNKINKSINPDEAVAYGAAIYAANFGLGDKTLLSTVIDVTSLSIGTNVQNDQMSIMIPRNTPLPANATRKYQTISDNQKTMDFPIYQGENLVASENILLGEFTMTDLTDAPAGKVKVEIECQIDVDGILRVSAKEISTKNTKEVTIDVKKSGLTEAQIQERIREAEINNERTRMRQQFNEKKYVLEQTLNEILKYTEKKDISNKDEILNKYDVICKWLESAKVTDLKQIEEHNAELTNLMKEGQTV